MKQKSPRSLNSLPNAKGKYCANKTEQSVTMDDKQSSCYYAQTEYCGRQESFLDYTFLSHREMIYGKKTKDPKKIRDYNFDLEKTLELNLDLLDKMDFKIYNSKQAKEIDILIKKIKTNNERRIATKQKIKEQKNIIVNKKQVLEEMNKKWAENDEIYENKYNEENEILKKKNEYIKILNKRFKDVQTYISIMEVRNKQRKENRPMISKFIKDNINYHKEKKMLDLDIKKLKEQITEIKKENQIYKEESLLYRNKSTNRELIRVVEFYRRIIRSLQTKIKILKNAFDNMTKTLNFLNLGDSKLFFILSFYSCQF